MDGASPTRCGQDSDRQTRFTLKERACPMLPSRKQRQQLSSLPLFYRQELLLVSCCIYFLKYSRQQPNERSERK